MSLHESLVRVVAASTATFISAFFVACYDSMQYHNAVEHEEMILPSMLNWIHDVRNYAFVVPLLILIVGIPLLKRQLAITYLASAGWLFAFAWALLCIMEWFTPYILL